MVFWNVYCYLCRCVSVVCKCCTLCIRSDFNLDCGLWLLVLCTNTTTGDELRATVMLGQVELFELEGGDWNVYTERLDQFLVANGVADSAKKVAVFLTVIGGRAYAIMDYRAQGSWIGNACAAVFLMYGVSACF